MLRIHFTAEDLARTVLAPGPDDFWEVVLSNFRLNERGPRPQFRPWLGRLAQDPEKARWVRMTGRLLATLAPLGPYFPDFLTPPEARNGWDAGLDALKSTPKRRLRLEFARLARHHRLPDWVRPLADGDVTALDQLGDAMQAHHRYAIAGHRDAISASYRTEQARNTRAFQQDGLAGVFRDIPAVVRWAPPVLEVDYAVDRDLELGGRGLRLVPSYFGQGQANALAADHLPPVLVYPMPPGSRWAPAAGLSPTSLDRLLGRTRASVLRAIDTGVTTTQLAHALGVSPASASQHATVLRDAGLITSRRTGRSIVHSLTEIGQMLLDLPAGPRPTRPRRSRRVDPAEGTGQPVTEGR